MWLQRKHSNRGHSKFFRVNINYDNLGNYFQTNFALMQHHKYSLTELENMIPWEREIYITLLLKHLQEETEKLKAQQQQRNRR